MNDPKDYLKSMLQDLINDRQEQAEQTIHSYLVSKTQQIAGLSEQAELTDAQKEELLDDFEEWSGGFTPDDCPWKGEDDHEKSVSQYIEHGMSTKLPKKAAIAYLKYIQANGASNSP